MLESNELWNLVMSVIQKYPSFSDVPRELQKTAAKNGLIAEFLTRNHSLGYPSAYGYYSELPNKDQEYIESFYNQCLIDDFKLL